MLSNRDYLMESSDSNIESENENMIKNLRMGKRISKMSNGSRSPVSNSKARTKKKKVKTAFGHISTQLQGEKKEKLLDLLEKVGAKQKFHKMKAEGRRLTEE